MTPPRTSPSEIGDTPGGLEVLRARLLALGEREALGGPAWPLFVFGVAAVVAFGLILGLNRGMTFSPDELSFFLTSPELSVHNAFEPYGGQLLLTTKVVYRAILEVFGSGYLPFRLMAAVTVVVTAGLFFAYASRAIGRVAALAPSLVLLLFGPDALHVLHGNTFTVLLPIACGIGALLALDRGDRLGDLVACALLCLAVVTFGTGLTVTAAVAIAILLRDDRWRRIWIVVVPVAIYGLWWLWARASTDGGSGVAPSQVLNVPAWGFESLGAALSSVVGLNYEFAGAPRPIGAGATLAVLALGALAWRATRGPLPRSFYAVLAAPLALWTLQALAATGSDNYPSSPHYMFPVTLLVLLVVVEAARGLRFPTAVTIVLFAVAAAGLATNFSILRDRASAYRYHYTPQARAALAAIDIVGSRADPRFAFSGLDLHPGLFAAFAGSSQTPTAAYLTAARDYGGLGYRPEEISESGGKGNQPYEAAYTDSVLTSVLRIMVAPAPGDVRATDCLPLAGARATFPVEPGRSVIVEGAAGPVEVQRFARLTRRTLGTATADESILLRFPPDAAPDRPWRVFVTGRSLRVCNAA